MCSEPESPASRWRLFLEARDTLRQALAPALPLGHLFAHGARIAKRLGVHRPKRPPQIIGLTKLIKLG